jgi:hypothetical protein
MLRSGDAFVESVVLPRVADLALFPDITQLEVQWQSNGENDSPAPARPGAER